MSIKEVSRYSFKQEKVMRSGFLEDGRHYTVLESGDVFVEPYLKEEGRSPTEEERMSTYGTPLAQLFGRKRSRPASSQGIKL